MIEVSGANKLSLPLANSIIRLMLTVPVTVASNERSFSQLKVVKNELRTSVSDARLTGLIQFWQHTHPNVRPWVHT